MKTLKKCEVGRTSDPRGRGFTLVELLLVLVILSILASVVVINVYKRPEQARIAAAKADISTIDGCLESFNLDCGRFPTSEEGINALIEQPSDVKNWQGPYLKKGLPKDPWGRDYQYSRPGQHNADSFDLWSNGPDGQPGTDDDITNWTNK
jgi:general secretion pathway protein G